MAAKVKFETKATSWLGITMDEAIDYLEANGTDADKKEFKKWLYSTKTGTESTRINWGNARINFIKKYCPELAPVAKEKAAKKSDRIANW